MFLPIAVAAVSILTAAHFVARGREFTGGVLFTLGALIILQQTIQLVLR